MLSKTIVVLPGRVVHQSGVKVNPLAHSALPDEANVIKNLVDKLICLKMKLHHKTLQCIANSESIDISKLVMRKILKTKRLLTFLEMIK